MKKFSQIFFGFSILCLVSVMLQSSGYVNAAYDGSGTFLRLTDFTADRDAGPPNNVLSADKFDNELDGMATGLSTAITKDNQTTTTAKIDFNTLGIATDLISESTSAAGVTIDGVLLKDSAVTTDTINEKTGGAGVTIDSVLLKDNIVTATTGTFTNIGGTLTTAAQTNITSVGTITAGVWSGTDVAIAAGGTGASTASDARTNLGLGTAAVATIGTSGDTVPKNNTNNVFSGTLNVNNTLRVIKSAGATITGTNGAYPLIVEDSFSGGAGGFMPMSVFLNRNTSGLGVSYGYQLKNSASDRINYGVIGVFPDDFTAGTEDSNMRFSTRVAGTLAERMRLGPGLQIGSPTGGDQGAGTINATGLFVDGVDVGAGSLLIANNLSDVASASTSRTNLGLGTLAVQNTVGTSDYDANSVDLAAMEHGTSGDILFYGSSGTPTRLAKGTDDQVLTLASGLPSWATGGGGGSTTFTGLTDTPASYSGKAAQVVAVNSGETALEFIDLSASTRVISEQEASTSASIEFLNLDGRRFEIWYQNVLPVSDNVRMHLQVSTDNGSTWKTSGYDSVFHNAVNSSSSTASLTTAVVLTTAMGNVITEGGSGKVSFSFLDGTSKLHYFFARSAVRNNTGDMATTMSSGAFLTTGAVNAVRLLMSGGNITSGTFTLLDVDAAGGSGPGWTKHGTEHLSVSSGTTLDWTGIPSTVSDIVIVITDHSASGADNLVALLGDSGGFETSGYVGLANSSAGNDSWSTSAELIQSTVAGNRHQTRVEITQMGGNKWHISALGIVQIGSTGGHRSAGYKALSAVLTQVRLEFSGSDTFDGGGDYVLYFQWKPDIPMTLH